MRRLGLLLLLAGCGEGKSTCTTGASVACACSDGSQGAQVCLPDGTFDLCNCSSPGRGNSIVDMGGDNNNPVIIRDLAVSPTSPGAKRVFVTSTGYSGGAVAGACDNAAAAAGLGGSWVAWLSKTNSAALDAVPTGGPWKLLTGEVAFNNHAALATQPLVTINVNENGAVMGNVAVWTGTANGGRDSGDNCSGWTDSNSGYGTTGTTLTPPDWTEYAPQNCAGQNHVYCFER